MRLSYATSITSTSSGRSLWLRTKQFFQEKIGWGLQKLHAPAVFKEFEFVDPETDQTIYLYTSSRYSVLALGDRRYYFDRITGKFDGTSSLPFAESVSRGIELAD